MSSVVIPRSEEKKNEKLNLRISEYEKGLMTSAAEASGYDNVSSWARKVLISNANIFETQKEKADLVIAITGNSIQFSSVQFNQTISIPNAVAYSPEKALIAVGEDALKNRNGFERPVFEGLVSHLDQFKMLLQIGFQEFSEKYSFTGSNILVAARTTQAAKLGLKKAISSTIPCKECFLVEYSMACAIGLGLPVTGTKTPPQPLICIEDDWLEMATMYYGGAHAKSSISLGFRQMIEEKGENLSLTMKRIGRLIGEHLGQLADFGTESKVAQPILTGHDEEILMDLHAYLKSQHDMSCDVRSSGDAAVLGSRMIMPELEKMLPIVQK